MASHGVCFDDEDDDTDDDCRDDDDDDDEADDHEVDGLGILLALVCKSEHTYSLSSCM